MAYLKTILIALDYFVGAFIPGAYPNETISSRAFREDWKLEQLINYVFHDIKHCENSYWNDIKRRQSVPTKL